MGWGGVGFTLQFNGNVEAQSSPWSPCIEGPRIEQHDLKHPRPDFPQPRQEPPENGNGIDSGRHTFAEGRLMFLRFRCGRLEEEEREAEHIKRKTRSNRPP